jgi:hypothetical protein
MTAFHFCFDLNHFGWIRQDFNHDPKWLWQRTAIVSLFLFCAGLGQAVAWSQRQQWPRFWRRWAQIAGCAVLVSIGSWWMFPQSWIYFGVLHGIAVMLVIVRLTAGWGRWLWLAGAIALLLPQLAQQLQALWPGLDVLNARRHSTFALVRRSCWNLRQLLLLQLLRDLRAHFFQLGQLRLADVVHADHVVAELRLHRLLRGLALLQLDHRLGELGHVAGRVGPVEVAAVGARSRVLGLLLGDVLELLALLQVGDDLLGLVFLLHQDVARLVFLAAVGRHELVVLGLDLGVGHRVLLLVVGEQLADQDGLAGQFHLRLEVVAGVQAALLRFLHEDLAGDHFVLELARCISGVTGRPALASCCCSRASMRALGTGLPLTMATFWAAAGRAAHRVAAAVPRQEDLFHGGSLLRVERKRDSGGFDGQRMQAAHRCNRAGHHTQGGAAPPSGGRRKGRGDAHAESGCRSRCRRTPRGPCGRRFRPAPRAGWGPAVSRSRAAAPRR